MKKILPILLLVLLSLSLVAAITGTIGNARMVLRAQTGDTLEKTILVRNTNNESINIEMFPSGDLENFTKITNPNFTLPAGESKDVSFSIKINQEGTTETKINIKFSSTTGAGGVGLSSTIVVMASNEPVPDTPDQNYQPQNSSDTPQEDTTSNSQATTPNPVIKLITENPTVTFLIALLVIFLILLLILLILTMRKTKQKRAVSRVE
jgi:hypothetical protein